LPQYHAFLPRTPIGKPHRNTSTEHLRHHIKMTG
jgi:hypothetical protein